VFYWKMLLHPEPKWRIFLTGGDIDDVISRFFSVGQFVYIIKRKLHGGLKI